MRLSARFNIAKDTLPTHWTFPQYGWNEGAQVLGLGRTYDMLMKGTDSRDDWYSSGKYPYLYLIEHKGAGGHSRMGYKALTESNVKAIYRIDRQMAEWIVRSEDCDVDDYQELLLEEAEEIEAEWVDPR